MGRQARLPDGQKGRTLDWRVPKIDDGKISWDGRAVEKVGSVVGGFAAEGTEWRWKIGGVYFVKKRVKKRGFVCSELG